MSYRKDIKAAWERVQAVPSRMFASLGPVEYALEGEGPPLLMSHGIQGSHVEGINMVGTYVGAGWMGIAPSRLAISAQLCPTMRHRRFKPTSTSSSWTISVSTARSRWGTRLAEHPLSSWRCATPIECARSSLPPLPYHRHRDPR